MGRRRTGNWSGARNGKGRNASGAGALGCLLVAALGFGGCLRCLGLGKSDERARQESFATAENTRREAERRREGDRAERERNAKAAEEKGLAEQRASYAAMTPVLREKTLRDACAGTACDAQTTKLVVEAAANPQERTKLEHELKTLEAAAVARERAREAQARAKAAQQQAQKRAKAVQVPREEPPGRVCCCDGTVSPTCTTVHRGCCSHHGGVCACN
ncbi:hypothetical protein [Polyangium mundeleinium]|uniref:Uncharacterized protein n=1 Tax=Polyangium mundeleinium TaxID=2995306 RepID=A0ABT5F7B6_9BACT|nr:hypothetical protein [Polyangium mundeleinium]MDC0750005.1 hypothetical protein [Polyangium mundeleinium]